jgi:hypothetical protein
MKRKGAELVQRRLAGMTRQQQLEFWREQDELLLKRQAELRARRSAAKAPATVAE